MSEFNSQVSRMISIWFFFSLLQKPELSSEINADVLGKLLPQELLKPLEEQFLNSQQVTDDPVFKIKSLNSNINLV